MAIMFPKECNKKVNKAEKKVFELLHSTLSDDIVCYHNYDVGSKETDFIVVIPNEGICIIEVKDWDGRQITEVKSKDEIKYRSGGKLKTEDSPLSQCKGYCYSLRNKIKKDLNINIKVVPIVFFPFMSEYTYDEKQLNIVTPRERTILQNDIEDRDEFIDILKQKIRNVKPKNIVEFTQQLYVNFCGLFEDNKLLVDRLSKHKDDDRKIIRMFTKRKYSILSYITLEKEEILFTKQMESFFNSWIVGTKIILIVRSKDDFIRIISHYKDKINENMAYLNGYNDFNIYDKQGNYKNRIFNLEIYYPLKGELDYTDDFHIVDGENIEGYINKLKEIDKCTDFNFNQYELEHSSYSGNIAVKAGAGTGKTYSMISRIGYLYYINNYTPEQLVKKIVMITFTNEATDNMQDKLKIYFTNLAILTESSEFIHLMEYISKMQISTIDSLMKRILQKFSVYLGLGNTIKITTEIYDTRQLISKELDDLLRDNRYNNILNYINKYELSKAVERFINLIYKKKIDLNDTNNFKEIEGDREKLVFDFIKEVASSVNAEIINKNIKENKVHLNNQPMFMNKLIHLLEEEQDKITKLVDYVFIDEFQDTDDLTIELIQRFQRKFGFYIFVVGDVKQSIYRFRGADDEAFNKLKRYTNKWVISKINNNNYFTINKNYRSSSELLMEFDKIFNLWGKATKGCANVLKYSKDDRLIGVVSKNDGLPPIKKVTCDNNNFDEELSKLLFSKVEELKEKGEGSLAILVRTNNQVEQIRKYYEEIYKQTQIPLETSKTENLYTMAPTIDLYRLVLALKYNNNPKYLYGLSLSNYAEEIPKIEVYKNRSNRQFINQLFNENRIIKNWSGEGGVIESLKKQTILRVIRSIILDTKPWIRYSLKFTSEEEQQYERIRYKRNLDLLLENIIQRSNSEYVTLNTLSKYLYIMIFAKQHLDERQAVNVEKKKIKVICETVHKSKGLEYEEVIIPYTSDKLNKRIGDEIIEECGCIYINMKVRQKDRDKLIIKSKNFDKETKKEYQDLTKEEARILYVALTRAKERVTWIKKKDEKEGNTSWSSLLEAGDINYDRK